MASEVGGRGAAYIQDPAQGTELHVSWKGTDGQLQVPYCLIVLCFPGASMTLNPAAVTDCRAQRMGGFDSCLLVVLGAVQQVKAAARGSARTLLALSY